MSPRRRWFSLLALFLLVVGLRFQTIHCYGTALPLADQWDAEGWLLLKPWREGHLRFAELFAPHNEHRIFLTRILALGLFNLSGQWSPLLEMAAGAVLAGLIAVAVAWALTDSVGIRPRSLVFVVVALCFLLPFGWENTVGGFQSQVYFLIGLSLVALWGLGRHPALSIAWWLGLGSASFSCLAMGSGFFAAACILGLTLVREIKTRTWSASATLTSFACAFIVAAGCLTRTVAHVNDSLRVESVSEFVNATGRYLAWPLTAFPWMALWITAPMIALGVFYLRKRAPERCSEMILVTGAWWILQDLALAYTRGAHQAPPASRYTDVLAVGLAAAFFALWLLLRIGVKWPHLAVAVVVIVWAAPIIFGLARVAAVNLLIEMPTQQAAHKAAAANIQAYLSGHDAHLSDKPPSDLPYPDVERLKMMLDDPTMRFLLQTNAQPVGWIDLILREGWILFAAGVAILLTIAMPPRDSRDV